MERLEDLRIFARVAELSSFTLTASALGLPKANVSAAVARLEDEIGARLLQRTTRKVQLTQDGAVFLERCKDLITDIEETYGMFRRKGARLSGRIRVDMPVPFARDVIVPSLPEFLNRHPALEIELGCTERRVDLVREGFDCVVRVGKIDTSDLVKRSIGHLSIISCASPAYLERAGTPRKVEDVLNGKHRLIHYSTSFGSGRDAFEYFDGSSYKEVSLPGVLTVNNADSYITACLAGVGLIQIPLVGVENHIRQRTLVEVLPKNRPEPMPISLLYPHRRNLPLRVQVFMDWLAHKLKAHAK